MRPSRCRRGVHWNQAASNALRTTIYDPIVERSFLGGAQLESPASPPVRPASPVAGNGVDVAAGNDSGAVTARRRSSRLGAVAGTAAVAGAPSAKAAAARHALQRRRLWGMAACFVASGLAHEVIFVYITGHPTRWLSWQAFFTGGLIAPRHGAVLACAGQPPALPSVECDLSAEHAGHATAGQVALIAGERRLLAWLQQRGLMPRLLLRRVATLVRACCLGCYCVGSAACLGTSVAYIGKQLFLLEFDICALSCTLPLQATLLVTAHFLFYAPAEAAGVPALFAASMRHSFAALAALPWQLAGR